MTNHGRRSFIKSLYGIWLLSHLPLTLADETEKHEYICQLEAPNGKNSILFFNLATNKYKKLDIPYIIHSIIPIKDNEEFILTSKGGYLFHVTREKIISSLKSPKDVMFYGHSTFFENEDKIYTSAIDFMDYDFTPTRQAQKKNPKDVTFGEGFLYEIALDKLKVLGRFTTGGSFPHDLRRINNSEIILLNSQRKDWPDAGGTLTIIDKNKKEVTKNFYLEKSQGYCPIAHMVGDKKLAFLGISDEACVILFDGKQMRKTALDPVVQKKYNLSEMLNADFTSDGSRVCAMNIDNKFLGIWDCKSGKLLKHSFEKDIVSINRYKEHFLVSVSNGLKFYDFDLNLKKEIRFEKLWPEAQWSCGPHTVII